MPAPIINGGGDAFEYGRIFDFQGLVTLTLTLDWVILHTVVHHSSTSTYIPNLIEIEENFCGRTYGRTFETACIRSTQPNQSIFGNISDKYVVATFSGHVVDAVNVIKEAHFDCHIFASE